MYIIHILSIKSHVGSVTIGSRVATERAVLLSALHSFIEVGSNVKVAMEFGTQVSTFGLTARIWFPAFTVSFENDESDRCWQTSRSWLHMWKDTAFLLQKGNKEKKKKKSQMSSHSFVPRQKKDKLNLH